MKKIEIATFAGGCFWCTEAVFQRLIGVEKVTSGYTGGNIPQPTYEQVSSGASGHAEAIQIEFDPDQITYEQLLEIFWQLHDPTTLNRQGADVGTQYRSAIFYHNDEQKKLAEKSKHTTEDSHLYSDPIVTEITQASEFYPAEEYHKEYYNTHSSQPYCRLVIDPKIQKLYKVAPKLVKSEN